MKIVFLDRKTIGEDIDLTKFHAFGDLVEYDFSTSQEIPARIEDADIIITNKCNMNEETLAGAKNLKLICVTATGTNNLDKEYLEKRKIAWRNVAGYSTETVAQHTFALLFYLYENLAYYDAYVKEEKYVNDKMFTHFSQMTFHQLAGRRGVYWTWRDRKRVAEIATVFGCKVQYFSTSGRNHDSQYQEVDLQTLLKTSDIVSIHAPLTDDTLHLIGEKELSQMKESAILINVGRGPIIVEKDLADALDHGIIAAAGIDVLDTEPMSEDNPLRHIKDSTKLLITPHIAWASVEARVRLMDIIYGQIKEFLEK